jgi:hypothetical protein
MLYGNRAELVGIVATDKDEAGRPRQLNFLTLASPRWPGADTAFFRARKRRTLPRLNGKGNEFGNA